MPDDQVFTNPSNSHCSVSQAVQNLSKFSFRIKSCSALSVDRRLLLSALLHHPPIRLRSNSKFFSCDFVLSQTTGICHYRTNETVINVLLRQVNQD